MTILSCFHDESSAYRFTERVAWKAGPVCPHCGENGRFGQLHGDTTSVGTWKCYSCRRLFSVRHKTPLYKSHLPVHVWLQGIYLIAATDGHIGACRLASVLGISFRSAVHMRCKVQLAIEARPEAEIPDRDDDDIEALTRSAPWQAGASDEDTQSGWCVARFDRFKAAVGAPPNPACHRVSSRWSRRWSARSLMTRRRLPRSKSLSAAGLRNSPMARRPTSGGRSAGRCGSKDGLDRRRERRAREGSATSPQAGRNPSSFRLRAGGCRGPSSRRNHRRP